MVFFFLLASRTSPFSRSSETWALSFPFVSRFREPPTSPETLSPLFFCWSPFPTDRKLTIYVPVPFVFLPSFFQRSRRKSQPPVFPALFSAVGLLHKRIFFPFWYSFFSFSFWSSRNSPSTFSVFYSQILFLHFYTFFLILPFVAPPELTVFSRRSLWPARIGSFSNLSPPPRKPKL